MTKMMLKIKLIKNKLYRKKCTLKQPKNMIVLFYVFVRS